ncbi:MAG: type II secretion system F family protein [Candidatus Gracilibacteria bacterium]
MSDIIILDNKDQNIKIAGKKKNSDFFNKLNNVFLAFQKIKIKDKVVFYRLVSVMLDSGMTLIRAITTLERQEKNKYIKDMYQNFLINLKEGKNLSECLENYSMSFSESEIGMVKSGEKTGKLNESLLSIADQVEKISSIITKLKGALIYPAIIIIVVLGVIIVMMIFVVPKLLEIFENKDALPVTTKLLINISDFLISYGWTLFIGLIVVYIFSSVWIQTEEGKFYFDKFKLNIPKFGDIYKKYILSKFARIFSNLIASGVSVVESLRIVANSLNNEIYRQRILLLMEDVKSGIKIWESIDSDPLFPDMMVQMIQVGEQTATLDKTIIKVADFYDEQFSVTIATINKLIEPLIIVFLAVTVGFIAISIMQPIMGLADQISNS